MSYNTDYCYIILGTLGSAFGRFDIVTGVRLGEPGVSLFGYQVLTSGLVLVPRPEIRVLRKSFAAFLRAPVHHDRSSA